MKNIFHLPDRAILKAWKKIPAFSLVEMLMALLVASLLLAALVPVVTKKIYTENLHVTSTSNNLQEVERVVKCLRLSDEIKMEDIAFSDNRVTFLLVSGGGGGGGASGVYKSPVVNFSTPTSSSSSYSSKTLNLNKDMVDFELETLIGGGGGGGGGTFTTTGNEDYCKILGNGKTDTTGHTGTLTLPIFVYNQGSKKCVTAYSQKASSGCIPYVKDGYSIPICSYSGAVAACNQLTNAVGAGVFSLPVISDMSNWTSVFMTTPPPNGIDEQNCGKTLTSPCHRLGAGGEACDPVYKIECRVGAVWSSTDNNWPEYCSGGLAKQIRHYYSRSGSPTFEGGLNCVNTLTSASSNVGYTQYSMVRCNAIPFISFSGGGGGGGTGIVSKDAFNNEVKTLFKKAIEDNLGNGSILIEAGKGGDKGTKGTDGANASAGGNGGESCISIYSEKKSGGNLVFKVCAAGGNGGKGAISSLSYKSGSSYYAAGGATKSANSCYYINSSGVKNSFNCSEGALGEHGYGAETKMEPTWGHGGSSPLSSNTFAGVSTVNGTTLNSITYAGSGGSGGRANTSSGTNTAGDGGAGASGLVKITYKIKKDGAGGGGGAGGNAVKISNIIFNKSYYDCKITVGQGGTGGNPGSTQSSGTAIKGDDGASGGSSSVTCDGGSTIFSVLGANGGKGGTGADASVDSVGGSGGAALSSSNATSGKLEGLKPAMINLTLGKQGDTPNPSTGDTVKIGGAGGKSGTKALGGCGGGVVNNDSENGCITLSETSPDGKGFKNDDVSDAYQFYGSNIITAWQNIVHNSAPSFGTAGSGGGGGTYKEINSIGKGGNGMPGYVCIFYTRAKK